MLIQHAGTGTAPQSVGGFTTPCWESLAEAWDATPEPSSATVTLGPATVELGHDDLEASDASLNGKDHGHKADVGEFRIEWRPITNSQFHEYWKTSEGKVPMPKSWVVNDGNVMVSNSFVLPNVHPFHSRVRSLTFLSTPRSAQFMDQSR
jgi:formylglycine-generating enzyme required for sulfatase activity